MKMFISVIIISLCYNFSFCQEITNPEIEKQLEIISEEKGEESDIDLLQNLEYYQKNPININADDISALKELPFFDQFKINNLKEYVRLFGKFISIYELQAVPGWDVEFIKSVLPFLSLGNTSDELPFFKRLTAGKSNLLLRYSRVLEKSKGYENRNQSKYLGSPEKLLLRYRYNYKNLVQYSFIGEKDAGEEFFKGSRKTGFDFYSFHAAAKNIGKIKILVIGDYNVNLGQGLLHWQSFSLGKGAEILAVKKQGPFLKPYSSAGEINFLRGAGITIANKNWSSTFFASLKNTDANFKTDTFQTYVTSLQTSGFHRTKSEIEDRKSQTVFTIGGNLSFKIKNLNLGINMVHTKFKYPVIKGSEPYNTFIFSGKSLRGISSDFSYTLNNFHLFGELARSGNGNAFIGGFLAVVSSNVSLSFLFRSVSRSFNSASGDAFTESSTTNNENGGFAGINIRLPNRWTVSGYVDVFKSPYLKYRINNNSGGFSGMMQVSYKPNKVFEAFAYYKTKQKGINGDLDEEKIYPVVKKINKNIRIHFLYKLNSSFSFASRAEISDFQILSNSESGFMLFADIIYKPFGKKLSLNSRIQYFDTDGYDSRIYSYEKDVLYASSISVLYDKGVRYMLNMKYLITRNVSCCAKIGQTVYSDRKIIGSGLDEIKGNKKTEFKLQFFIN